MPNDVGPTPGEQHYDLSDSRSHCLQAFSRVDMHCLVADINLDGHSQFQCVGMLFAVWLLFNSALPYDKLQLNACSIYFDSIS